MGFSISNDIVKREQPLSLRDTRLVMLATGVVYIPLGLASAYLVRRRYGATAAT